MLFHDLLVPESIQGLVVAWKKDRRKKNEPKKKERKKGEKNPSQPTYAYQYRSFLHSTTTTINFIWFIVDGVEHDKFN